MLGSSNRRSRSGLWFAAFTVASLLMLLASRTDPAVTLQQASARALEPVRAAVAGVGQGVVGLFGTIASTGEVRNLNLTNVSVNSSVNSQLVGTLAGTNLAVMTVSSALTGTGPTVQAGTATEGGRDAIKQGTIQIGNDLGGQDADQLILEASEQINPDATVLVTGSGVWNLNNFSEQIGNLTNATPLTLTTPAT